MAARKAAAKKKRASSTPDPDQVRKTLELVVDPYFEEVRLELDALRRLSETHVENLIHPEREYFKLHEHPTILDAADERKKLKEAIIFDPKVNAVPVGSGDQMAKLALEDLLWQPGPTNTVVSLHTINLVQVIKTCVVQYQTHPLARNIVDTYTYLTIGEGVRVSWNRGRGRRSEERLAREWKKVERSTRFQEYVKRMVRMTFMCGEWFTVTTPLRRTSGAKKSGLKGVEPDLIQRIFFASDDIEDVRGYERLAPDGSRQILSPDDVVHSKVGTIGNIPRGIPVLLPVLLPLRYYQLFVENRHWLGMSRARIPVVRKVAGNAAQVSAERSRIENMGLPQPGTVVVDPGSYDWQFPQMNLGSSDAVADRQMLVQAIAAGVGLPEWLVTADLSSANYSSAIVAESPMVRKFMDFQDSFKGWISELICELMDVPPDSFEVGMPPVVRRGVGELSAALGVAVDRQVLSRKTAAEMLGKSWDGPDGEAARIASESEELFAFDGFGFPAGNQPMPTDQKKKDGGVGSVPTGTSQGAAASSRERPDTDPDAGAS